MNIVWRKQAETDLAEAVASVAPHNPEAARKLFTKIRTAVERLRQHPAWGRPGRVADTRELVIVGTRYLVPYTVDTEREYIVILRVLHGARLWPEEFDTEDSG